MKPTITHTPGYSSYDHYAAEVKLLAEREGRRTVGGTESALARAWLAVQPHVANGPRFVVR